MSDQLQAELQKRGLLPTIQQPQPPQVPTTDDPIQIELQRRGINLTPSVDRSRGAPLSVRAVVGSVSNPDDRLASLRTYYPDAQPYGKDNFIFKDPKTGRPTLYNPPGLDIGDVASMGHTVAQQLGGTTGAIFGAAAAAPEGFMTAPFTAPLGFGLGSQAGGELFDRAAGITGHRIDTRSLPQRVADVTAGTMADSSAAAAGPLISNKIRGAFSAVKNRMAGTTPDETLAVFDRIGAKPSADIATGSRPVQVLANAARKSIGGGATMQGSDDALIDDLKTYAAQTAQKFGEPMSPEGLGSVIEDASKGAITRRISKADELYTQAAKLIPQDMKLPPEATIEFAHNLQSAPVAAELPNTAPTVQNKGVNSIMSNFASDVINPDGSIKPVSYQALHDLRSRVGKILGSPEIYSDFDTAQMKGLYGALSTDMENIADAAGPEAAKADALASRYYRRSIQENILPLQSIADKATPEKVFNAAMSGTRDGSTTLKLMRRNFTPEQWDSVAGTALSRMGRANPGVQSAEGDAFSPETFLTNWEKMSPEAKATLFQGKRYADLAPALDDLVTASAAVKDIAGTENRSNTAGSLAALSALYTVGGLAGHFLAGEPTVGGLSAVGGELAGPYMAAKLITNPKFVRWLADTTTKTAANPAGLASQLGGLIGIAKVEPDMREAIHQYMDSLRQQ